MTGTPTSDNDGEETAHIAAVLAGDTEAFRRLYRMHATPLYRLALRLSGGREAAAEDVLQETWVRAVRGLPSFERRSSLRTWLSGIVVRCSLERIRADSRAAEGIPDASMPPRVPPGSVEARIDLERAFEALPPGYRAVLVLHDIEGYTHDDIAAVMRISTGTSKSQLSRARAWMRQALGPDYFQD